jgi:hypothetical protein
MSLLASEAVSELIDNYYSKWTKKKWKYLKELYKDSVGQYSSTSFFWFVSPHINQQQSINIFTIHYDYSQYSFESDYGHTTQFCHIQVILVQIIYPKPDS